MCFKHQTKQLIGNGFQDDSMEAVLEVSFVLNA